MKQQDQIKIPLALKEDANKDEYMVGTTDLPVFLDMSKSIFLVFFPPENGTVGSLLIRQLRPKKSREQ